ncbi:MAG TPA: hypothetical protein PK472_11260 [Pseudomonadota bacterium]|nr:hypothetical protein [Pseudomonadota bacterium]HNN53281.1 hypothetical protein [Pseudomonadota bacterium]
MQCAQLGIIKSHPALQRFVQRPFFEVIPNAVSKDLWPSCLSGWDGVDITKAETMCGLKYVPGKLARAHFGLYAPPLLSAGEVWNDDLEILGQ